MAADALSRRRGNFSPGVALRCARRRRIERPRMQQVIQKQRQVLREGSKLLTTKPCEILVDMCIGIYSCEDRKLGIQLLSGPNMLQVTKLCGGKCKQLLNLLLESSAGPFHLRPPIQGAKWKLLARRRNL
jgi:hypothetical protein